MLPIWVFCTGEFGCNCPQRLAEARKKNLIVEHGTRRVYQQGCRCKLCVAANRQYSKDYRSAHGNA